MNKNAENFFIGVILGAAVGSTTALLLAPDKGKRTRKRISRKFKELNNDLEDIIDRSRDEIQHLSENLENNLSDAARRGKKVMGK